MALVASAAAAAAAAAAAGHRPREHPHAEELGSVVGIRDIVVHIQVVVVVVAAVALGTRVEHMLHIAAAAQGALAAAVGIPDMLGVGAVVVEVEFANTSAEVASTSAGSPTAAAAAGPAGKSLVSFTLRDILC
ncbi:hypothetical protein HK102_001357 [Quaeritorhiza haematococci]|nr:hypothetical protein HK102_001357 [Quaeritorhiza haematococci]